MNKFVKFSLIALIFACGGESEDPPLPEYVPGQEGRLDGSVWEDGFFNSPEAKIEFCSEFGQHPAAWFCRESPMRLPEDDEKANWASAEYHGLGSGGGGTCYGPGQQSAGSDDCVFPNLIQYRRMPTTTCDAITDDGLIGLIQGINKWIGSGSNPPGSQVNGVQMLPSTDSRANSWLTFTISCQNTTGPSGSIADGWIGGVTTTKVTNAPVGPTSGVDLDDFRTAPTSGIIVYLVSARNNCRDVCNAGSLDCTASQLMNYFQSTGEHEMGHALGFSHFDTGGTLQSNVMYPFRGNMCSGFPTIKQKYKDALFIYNSSANNPVVSDVGLNLYAPL